MKTRKWISCILMVAVLMGLLVGCGSETQTPTESVQTQPTQATEPKDTEPVKNTESVKDTEPVQVTEPSQPTEPLPTVPACNHVVENKWKVEIYSTCTTEGLRVKRCTQCKEVVESEVIPVRDHDPGSWIVDRAATCDKEGLQHQECRQCKETIVYVNMEKKAHTPNLLGTKCAVCGETLPQS